MFSEFIVSSWIIDSSMPTNMTSKCTVFFTFHTSSAPFIVFTYGSSKCSISTGTGTVNVTSLTLIDVNYISHVPFNLVSESFNQNSSVIFSPSLCIVQDKKVISEEYKQDDLYYLQCDNQPKVSASALTCYESAIQWHSCLGHASLKSIKLLFPSIKDVSKLQCATKFSLVNIIEVFFI